jgi:hypothetical protein
MNENLRDRIMRKLAVLSDERGYQILDYVEFLESRYAERASEAPSIFQRFTEAVEDRMRAGRVSAATIAETVGLMTRAIGVLNGVAAAGKSVASDIVGAATRPAGSAAAAHPSPAPAAPSAAPPATPSEAAPGATAAGPAPVTAPGVMPGTASGAPPGTTAATPTVGASQRPAETTSGATTGAASGAPPAPVAFTPQPPGEQPT